MFGLSTTSYAAADEFIQSLQVTGFTKLSIERTESVALMRILGIK